MTAHAIEVLLEQANLLFDEELLLADQLGVMLLLLLCGCLDLELQRILLRELPSEGLKVALIVLEHEAIFQLLELIIEAVLLPEAELTIVHCGEVLLLSIASHWVTVHHVIDLGYSVRLMILHNTLHPLHYICVHILQLLYLLPRYFDYLEGLLAADTSPIEPWRSSDDIIEPND